MLALLLPAAAVSYLPASLLPGALLALGRAQGEPSRRASGRLLAASCVLAGLTFVLAAWVVPDANRRYLSMVLAARGMPSRVDAGPREQTIGQLSRSLSALERDGKGSSATRYRFERQKRFALPAGALAFALLALGLARRGVARRAATSLLAALALVVRRPRAAPAVGQSV